MVHCVYGSKSAPFLGGAGSPSYQCCRAEAYLRAKFHLDPYNRLANGDNKPTLHSHTDRQDRQRSDSTGEPFYKWSPENLLSLASYVYTNLVILNAVMCQEVSTFQTSPLQCPPALCWHFKLWLNLLGRVKTGRLLHGIVITRTSIHPSG